MADKTISELTGATGVNLTDLFLLSQGSSSLGFDSKKLVASDLAVWLANQMEFTQQLSYTTAKTLIGAINEIAQSGGGGGGGATIYVSTSAPSSVTGSNGDLYVQYTHDSGTDTDSVDALYVKINGTWDEISTGGSGGVSDLDDLSDVNISSPSAGQVLTYDATTSKWKNANAGAGSSDVFVITYSNNQFDKTVTEVVAAYDSHKVIYLVKGSEKFICSSMSHPTNSSLYDFDFISFDQLNEGVNVLLQNWMVRANTSNDTLLLMDDAWTNLIAQEETTDTLLAGQTSISFDATASGIRVPFSPTSTIDIYTDIFGVNPTAAAWSVDSITGNDIFTLTFEAQASDMEVKVRWSN